MPRPRSTSASAVAVRSRVPFRSYRQRSPNPGDDTSMAYEYASWRLFNGDAQKMTHHVPSVALVLVLLLAVSACTGTDSSGPVPVVTREVQAQLQARAFLRACQDVICAGSRTLAPDSTSPAVREAISLHTDEVEYLEVPGLDAFYTSDGLFLDGAVMLDAGPTHSTERADVIGVDVWISRGLYEFTRRTYLFRWDGTVWVDTSPDAVDVTVTTSVS